MEIEINLLIEMIDNRINILHYQIERIQKDERIKYKREHMHERMHTIKELQELKEDLLEIERMC